MSDLFITIILTIVGFFQALFFYLMSSAKQDHNKMSAKLVELESRVAVLQANEMTETKTRSIMHDQLAPVVKSIDKLTDKVDRVDKAFSGVIDGLKESISSLDNEQAILNERQTALDERIKHQNGNIS